MLTLVPVLVLVLVSVSVLGARHDHVSGSATGADGLDD